MTWDQIRELSNEDFVEIGNHSHTHEYLIDEESSVIKNDILKSMKIFDEKLQKQSQFFLILLVNIVWNLRKL